MNCFAFIIAAFIHHIFDTTKLRYYDRHAYNTLFYNFQLSANTQTNQTHLL